MSEQLDREQAKVLREFFQAREAAGAWKKVADAKRLELEELIGAYLDETNEFADEDGSYVGRVRHVTGKRLNTKRLRAENPAVYAEFEEETNQVRIEEPS